MQAYPEIKKDAVPWRAGHPFYNNHTSGEVGGGALNIPVFRGNEGTSFSLSRNGLAEVLQAPANRAGLLVNITNNVSTSRHYSKYRLQAEVVKELQGMNMRVQNCMRASSATVDIIREGDGHAHAHGVWVCRSVWLCPVCSRRIGEMRRAELLAGVKASGLYPVMATLTIQHVRMDPLKELARVLKSSWRETKAGRGWGVFQDKHGIAGYITVMEVRASANNGWHPHLHVLFLCRNEVEVDTFRQELIDIYTRKVEKAGGYASQYHSIEVTAGDEGLASYVSKGWDYSRELFTSDSKVGRKAGSYSVWDLAHLASEGDKWARGMFQEYARDTFGRRQITYSRGMKELLSIDKVKEVEEKDAQGTIPEVIISINRTWWGVIHRRGVVGDVLYLAETGGAKAVNKYLQGIPPPYGQRFQLTC